MSPVGKKPQSFPKCHVDLFYLIHGGGAINCRVASLWLTRSQLSILSIDAGDHGAHNVMGIFEFCPPLPSFDLRISERTEDESGLGQVHLLPNPPLVIHAGQHN